MKIQEIRHLTTTEELVILEASLDSKLNIHHFSKLRRCGKLDYYVYPFFRCKFFNEQLVLLGAIGNKYVKLWLNAGFENVLLENFEFLMQSVDTLPENMNKNAESSL